MNITHFGRASAPPHLHASLWRQSYPKDKCFANKRNHLMDEIWSGEFISAYEVIQNFSLLPDHSAYYEQVPVK